MINNNDLFSNIDTVRVEGLYYAPLKTNDGKITVLIEYIKDHILTRNNRHDIKNSKELLAKNIDVKYLRALRYSFDISLKSQVSKSDILSQKN